MMIRHRGLLGFALITWIGIVISVATSSQQAPGQPPAGQPPPPPFGGRGFVPGTEFGFATFQTKCSICHGNPNVERAPSPAAIREMPPEKIYDALTTGVMQVQANDLTDAQKRTLAEFMS